MNLISSAFADSAPPAPASGTGTTASTSVAVTTGAPAQPGPLGMLMPFALMFVVIYFLIIRPQQKKMKDHQALIDQIKHGDEVVTNAGIFGKITGITEKVLTVEIADGVRIKMLKGQIASVNPNLNTLSKEAK